MQGFTRFLQCSLPGFTRLSTRLQCTVPALVPRRAATPRAPRRAAHLTPSGMNADLITDDDHGKGQVSQI